MPLILLFRFEGVGLSVLEGLEAPLGEAFDMPVRIADGALALPPAAFDPQRRQWRATALVDEVAGAPVDPSVAAAAWTSIGGSVRLGVVGVDLFSPELCFVFGEASSGKQGAVFSITRLDYQFFGLPRSHPQHFEERCATEAVHELGHVLGLWHCPDRGCPMWFSNTLAETDGKGCALCEECQARLAARMGQPLP